MRNHNLAAQCDRVTETCQWGAGAVSTRRRARKAGEGDGHSAASAKDSDKKQTKNWIVHNAKVLESKLTLLVLEVDFATVRKLKYRVYMGMAEVTFRKTWM